MVKSFFNGKLILVQRFFNSGFISEPPATVLFQNSQIDTWCFLSCIHCWFGSDGEASAYSARDPGSIPGSGRSPGEGNGNPLQYFCLENPMDRGAWGSQRVGHDGATSVCVCVSCIQWKQKDRVCLLHPTRTLLNYFKCNDSLGAHHKIKNCFIFLTKNQNWEGTWWFKLQGGFGMCWLWCC